MTKHHEAVAGGESSTTEIDGISVLAIASEALASGKITPGERRNVSDAPSVRSAFQREGAQRNPLPSGATISEVVAITRAAHLIKRG